MSKLENIVVSLELAKKLKANNYPQESLFYIAQRTKDLDPEVIFPNREIRSIIEAGGPKNVDYYAAPTSTEILERLPVEIIGDEGMRFDFNIWIDNNGKLVCAYWWDEDSRRSSGMNMPTFSGNRLVGVLGETWLYLKEHNLLKDL